MIIRTKGIVRASVVAGILLVSGMASAHVGEHLYSDAKAKIVTLKPTDYKAELRSLMADGYDIAGVDPVAGTVDIVVGEQQFAIVSNQKNLNILHVQTIDTLRAPDSQYTPFAKLTTILNDVVAKYPELVKLESTGKSHEGRDIWAVKISENVGTHNPAKPVVFFNAMHHAREVMTTEIALDIIETLTTGYGSNDRIKNWLARNEIWIVPMVNPDGNNKVWTSNNMWRKNTFGGYGVDINRNYPYKWAACNGSSASKSAENYHGPSAGSEPETQAMMNLVAKIKPVLSISYHSYSELVIYPLGCDNEYVADRELVETVGKTLAGRLPKDSGRGTYSPGTSWELLYPVDGGDIDWFYSEHDVLPYVIEVNGTAQGFQPAFSWRQKTVEKMRAGWGYMIDRLEQSGIRGRVLSREGRPITSGQVIVESMAAPAHDAAAVRPWRIKPDGSFHVLTGPGMYRVKVVSGDQAWEQDVTVGGTRSDLDVHLN
jgi:carboxypeptidase T